MLYYTNTLLIVEATNTLEYYTVLYYYTNTLIVEANNTLEYYTNTAEEVSFAVVKIS